MDGRLTPPACTCHGEPMYWNRDARRPDGGRWRCGVQHREKARARYARQMGTDEGRASHRARWMRNYKNRRDDPLYQLQRQLSDMTRVRV